MDTNWTNNVEVPDSVFLDYDEETRIYVSADDGKLYLSIYIEGEPRLEVIIPGNIVNAAASYEGR